MGRKALINIGDIKGDWKVLSKTDNPRKVLCECIKCSVTKELWTTNILAGKALCCGCDATIADDFKEIVPAQEKPKEESVEIEAEVKKVKSNNGYPDWFDPTKVKGKLFKIAISSTVKPNNCIKDTKY